MGFLKKFLAMSCVAVLASCAGQKNASSQERQSFILKFKAGVSQADQDRVLEALDLKMEKRLDLIGAQVCVHQGDMSPGQVIEKGQAHPELEYIELDQTVRIPE